jgi:predicted outer membrane repeat protein
MWFLALGLGCGDGEPVDHGAIDDDGDGTVLGTDCDDTDASVRPGADEKCNGLDDDCDGMVDEDAIDGVAVFVDADADGYGSEADGTACVPGANQAAASGDCDDADPGAHPGATEICNGGVDDDCDGAADDADDSVGGVVDWYVDEDQDGYGSGAASSSCIAPEGRIADASDCDDVDAAVHPGAEETCNGIDDDCDPSTSETGMVWRAGVLYWAIQDAIDDSLDGDLVEICSGTFYENLLIDKSIELAGVSSELSIIDGSVQQQAVISVVRPGVLLTVRGLTVQNGVSDWDSGGISAQQAGGLVVEDSAVLHNSAWYGGGIVGPEHGPASILSTLVSDNSGADGSGGGIVLYNDGTGDLTEIRDSEVTNNLCGYLGGGVFVADSSGGPMAHPVATISDTLIDGNWGVASTNFGASGGGLGSFVDLTLSGVTVSNNDAPNFGGGIAVYANATADDTTVISGNTAGEGGGGIYVSGGTWQYGSIEGNTASLGGGLALSGGQVSDVLVEANTATTAGGGVYIYYEGGVRNSAILSNVSAGGGGGIYATYTSSQYDAVVDDCTIEGNVAAIEGGGALIVNLGFRSVSSDWGSGATDNDPDDLTFYATTTTTEPVTLSDLETAEDFVCDVRDAVCE